MSFAVHSLQKAIVEGNQPLTQLLRQAKLIAAKLGVQDVEKWVDLELKGYPLDTEPPEYRSFSTETIMVHHPYRGWMYAGDFKKTVKASQAIAEIEQLSKLPTPSYSPDVNLPMHDGMGNFYGSDWPQRITTSAEKFKNVLEAVRNELLQWTIELEKRGIEGKDMNFDEKEKQSATSQVFNIGTVHGTVGNITNSQVTLYDYSSVQQLLIDRRIPKQDRRELEDIMDELKEAPPEQKPSLIKRGEDWIVKHKDLLGAGAEAIGKAIGAAMKH